ncbi:MAG: UDP-N-acetylglucosamine 2-epimerase [Candidatus Delongbacteria bacterium]
MKVLAVTGSRSDYDLLEPVLRQIEAHPGLELTLVVTCAHLAKAWGGTGARIHGFSRTLLRPTLIDWDSPEARLKSMGLELIALAQDLAEERPDLVLVLGDREDALLAATAASYSWIPVAHIFGGDLGHATVDDSVRHAVSKLAHLHFVASEGSRDVLLRLGEDPGRIHVCGNPALDRIRRLPAWPAERLLESFGIVPARPLILVCQHPVGPNPQAAAAELELILAVCRRVDAQVVVNTPNSDPGSSGPLRVWEEADQVIRVRNLEQEAWVALLKRCNLMLGNSSAGLLETPFLGIPAVNVGARQRGRSHAGNVQFVEAEAEGLQAAIHRALDDADYRAQVRGLACPFGDGHAAERVVGDLAGLECRSLLPKRHILARSPA